MIDEFEEDDHQRQAARFRTVRSASSVRGHVIAVMSCTGREALLGRTLTSLSFSSWMGREERFLVKDGYQPRGQAATFFTALRRAADTPGFTRLTLFEDDIVAAKNALNYITAIDIEDFSMVSWFSQHAPNPPLAAGDVATWMIAPAREHSCNQAITMPAATVHALLDSIRRTPWSEPHGADMLIGQVMPDARVAYHFPNLVDHVGGDASLVGNTGDRRSPTFVGEHFDALDLTRTP